MTKEQILQTLKQLKPKYEKEGFYILGLFGSYTRDEAIEDSDIDILIETSREFLEKYRGFRAYSKFDEIKEELSSILKKEIDFVDRQGLIQHNNSHIIDRTLFV